MILTVLNNIYSLHYIMENKQNCKKYSKYHDKLLIPSKNSDQTSQFEKLSV